MANHHTYSVLILTLLTVVEIGGLTLHGLGIYVLVRVTSFPRNQQLILLNLSFTEMLQMLACCFTVTTHLYHFDALTQEIVIIIQYYMSLTWVGILMLMTVNRFLEIYLHLRYAMIVTKRKVTLVIVAIWGLGLLVTTTALFLRLRHKLDMTKVAHVYIWPAVFVMTTAVSIVVFSYIYLKIRKAKGSYLNHFNTWFKRCSHFLPAWIVLAFLVFFVVPETIISLALYYKRVPSRNNFLIPSLVVIFNIGFTTDAIIYIFLNQNLRKKFVRLWRNAPPCAKKMSKDMLQQNGRRFTDVSIATLTCETELEIYLHT